MPLVGHRAGLKSGDNLGTSSFCFPFWKRKGKPMPSFVRLGRSFDETIYVPESRWFFRTGPTLEAAIALLQIAHFVGTRADP